jgi:parvulin-like peptidyl-prolyl isomerase
MSKTSSAPATPTRKQLSRAQRDRRFNRLVVGGAAVVGGLVVLLIIYGLVDINLLQPRQPVARVNEATISTADFQKAVRYRRFQLLGSYSQTFQTMQLFGSDEQTAQYFQQQLGQIQSQLDNSEDLGRQVLNQLIEEQIIRQEAARRGISVSAEEVEIRLRESFGFFPDGTQTPTITASPFPTDEPIVTLTPNPTLLALWTPTATFTPTATLTVTLTPTAAPTITPTATVGPSATPSPTSTPRATATAYATEAYRQQVVSYTADIRNFTGLNEADFRHFIESELYREKVMEVVITDVVTSKTEYHVRHILVEDAALATSIAAKAQAGEDFAFLAAQYSIDGSSVQGGDLGWDTPDAWVTEFANAVISATVNIVSDPVQSQFGWHIIEVLETRERPRSDFDLETERETAFTAWLQAQRDAAGSNVEIFDRWEGRVPDQPDLLDLQSQSLRD